MTRNSRLRPAAEVSVTCIGISSRPEIEHISAMFWENPPGWCGRRGSNPHDFRHGNLNPARLPIPPRPRREAARRRGLYHAGGARHHQNSHRRCDLQERYVKALHASSARYTCGSASGKSSAISPGPNFGGLAMQPDGRDRGFKIRHALRQEAGSDPGQHVAGAGRRQISRRIAGNGGAAVGRGHDGVGALEHHDRADKLRRQARPFELRTCLRSSVQGTKYRANSPSWGVRPVARSRRARSAAARSWGRSQSW